MPIRPLRGVRRARGLDHREGRGEIVERDVACLQDQAEGAGGVLGRRSMHLRAADVPSTDGDEALALEDSQRFPERRSRHLELADELVLLRQHGAVGERPVDDLRPDGVSHHLGDARLRELTTMRDDDGRLRGGCHRRASEREVRGSG